MIKAIRDYKDTVLGPQWKWMKSHKLIYAAMVVGAFLFYMALGLIAAGSCCLWNRHKHRAE